MAELATIARPYAEAAFALAREHNALPVWSQMLRLASRVVADPRVAAALDNPLLDAAAKESLLLSICGDELNPDGRNFVRVLIEADRITVLPAIQALFEALKDDADGVAKATIETAFPLEGNDLAGTAGGARAPVRQEDRGDGRREAGVDRRRAHHRRRQRDRRHRAGTAAGHGNAVTGLNAQAVQIVTRGESCRGSVSNICN